MAVRLFLRESCPDNFIVALTGPEQTILFRGLFSHAVSRLYWVTGDNELESIWKEAVLAW
jgi:hypothetical protein